MRTCLVLRAIVVLVVCSMLAAPAPVPAAEWSEVTDWRLLEADKDANNWLTYYRTYNGWRHSPLSQINPQNVRRLTPKWMLSVGEAGNQQATPLVNNGVMFLTSPLGVEMNRVYAIDATTGRVLWKHETKIPEEVSGLVRILPMNRGAALYKDKVYFGTLDSHVIALKAATGEVAWKVKTADFKDGYFHTMAPLAAKGKIIIGSSGPGEMGPRGFIAALDADTGRELWRTYTIPAAGEPGSDTWPGESWKYGGGAVWLTGTYDPQLNLVFFGVGNPAPWDANLRKGANLYTDSTIALDVDTGRMKWFFQYHGNDTWDLDTPHENLLLTISRAGRQIPITFQPNKTGFHFSLERATGKFVAAKRFTRFITIWKDVDPESGKLIENAGMRPAAGAPPMDICPSIFGGRNWAHASFHPGTGLVYLPSMEMCNKYSIAKDIQYKRGALYIGADFTAFAAQDQAGVVRAINPNTGDTAWEWWTRAPIQAGGVVSTGGGLVFAGTQDGRLVALDARTGEQLWEFSVGAPVTAPPITYSVGGKQYVAVLNGGGKVTGDLLVGNDPRLQYLKNVPVGGTLTVFGLFD
ncbi:MAG: PQQ-dependent dehydrogenase, methanol/ethanol family [Candidatus Rokubacteria bacterium]|nr:PQQ-dependent dehydrogenase, methanol/ethanol family [Candidatus Rokubacteria bacterium]